MNLRKIAGDSAVYGTATGAGAAATAIGLLAVTSGISVSQFGVLTLAITVVSLSNAFGTLGIGSGIQYFYFLCGPTDVRQRHRVVMSGVLVAFVSLTIITIIAGLIIGPVLSFSLFAPKTLLLMLALAWTTGMGQVLQDLRRLRFRAYAYASTTLIRSVLGNVLAVTFVICIDASIDGYLLGLLIGSALALICALLLSRSDLGGTFECRTARAILKYSWPLAGAGAASWVSASSGVWLLAYLADDAAVGVYGLAVRMGGVINVVIVGVSQAWSPRMLQAWADRRAFNDLYSRFSIAWSTVLVCTYLVAVPCSTLLITAISGPAYAESVGLLPIILFTSALNGVSAFSAVGLTLAARTRTIAALGWCSALLNLALGFLLVDLAGVQGAAIANLLAVFFVVIGYAIASGRATEIHSPRGAVIAIWSIAAFAGVLAAAAAGRGAILSITLSLMPAVALATAGYGFIRLKGQRVYRDRSHGLELK